MGYYLHAFLLRENGALPENTTLKDILSEKLRSKKTT
jgi:hypothetical protein